MRTILKWAAVLAIAAMPVAATAFSARALPVQVDPDIVAAGKQLKAKLDSAARDTAPTLRNADAPLVRRAFSEKALRALPATPAIGDACVSIGEAIVAYVDYATRTAEGETDPAKAHDAIILAIQDELTLGTVAANICTKLGFVAVVQVVEGMSASDRTRVTGPLTQMRQGASMTFRGTLDSSADPAMRPANRGMMLTALVEAAVSAAPSLLPADRAPLRERALELARGATPEARKQLDAIAQGFATTACDVLCKAAGGS
ncbi:MAG: hypothetical protein EOP59_01625 [Sphingomonadales bacterium]|nr:MAG: hypothetical protein EOP59_01625 [Sphingomonadales bacterium]